MLVTKAHTCVTPAAMRREKNRVSCDAPTRRFCCGTTPDSLLADSLCLRAWSSMENFPFFCRNSSSFTVLEKGSRICPVQSCLPGPHFGRLPIFPVALMPLRRLSFPGTKKKMMQGTSSLSHSPTPPQSWTGTACFETTTAEATNHTASHHFPCVGELKAVYLRPIRKGSESKASKTLFSPQTLC
jgi:hypothetical protein